MSLLLAIVPDFPIVTIVNGFAMLVFFLIWAFPGLFLVFISIFNSTFFRHNDNNVEIWLGIRKEEVKVQGLSPNVY